MTRDTVIYQGVEEDVYELLHRLGISTDRYSYRIRKGMLPQAAFNSCLNIKKRSNSGTMQKIDTDDLKARGIPEQFQTLLQFCLWARIDYNSFAHLWRRFPTYCLTELYHEYLKIGPIVSSNNCIYYGISLKAMCIEFQISYRACNEILDQNHNKSLFEVFQFALIQTYPLVIQKFLKRIGWIDNLEQLDNIAACYLLGENAKRYLLSYYQRSHKIFDALCAYQMVYFFEEGWLSLYEEDVKKLRLCSKSEQEYTMKLRDFKKNIFQDQMNFWNINSTSIQEFYQKYYHSYLKDHAKNIGVCWGYNRKLTRLNVK